MIGEEERREIIEQAKQEFMLILPEVMGTLMANHASFAKMNTEFYQKYPEFKEHKAVVASILEQVDGENTTAPYESKLIKAVPLIRERIAVMKNLDLTKADRKVVRSFPDFNHTNNGAL